MITVSPRVEFPSEQNMIGKHNTLHKPWLLLQLPLQPQGNQYQLQQFVQLLNR